MACMSGVLVIGTWANCKMFCLQVSTSVPSSAFEDIAEMNWNLERSEKDLDLMNKQIEQSQSKSQNIIKFTLHKDSFVKKKLMMNCLNDNGFDRA